MKEIDTTREDHRFRFEHGSEAFCVRGSHGPEVDCEWEPVKISPRDVLELLFAGLHVTGKIWTGIPLNAPTMINKEAFYAMDAGTANPPPPIKPPPPFFRPIEHD